METMKVRTRQREEMMDITSMLRSMVHANGWTDGALLLYCPHTTGAVTINEGADPDVVRDITVNMNSLSLIMVITNTPKATQTLTSSRPCLAVINWLLSKAATSNWYVAEDLFL